MNPLQLAIIEKIENYNGFEHVLVFELLSLVGVFNCLDN
jgi:hypothetical protein